jgi:hypothetical protein
MNLEPSLTTTVERLRFQDAQVRSDAKVGGLAKIECLLIKEIAMPIDASVQAKLVLPVPG